MQNLTGCGRLFTRSYPVQNICLRYFVLPTKQYKLADIAANINLSSHFTHLVIIQKFVFFGLVDQKTVVFQLNKHSYCKSNCFYEQNNN